MSRLVCLVVSGFVAVSASQIVVHNKVQNDLFQEVSTVEYFYEELVSNM